MTSLAKKQPPSSSSSSSSSSAAAANVDAPVAKDADDSPSPTSSSLLYHEKQREKAVALALSTLEETENGTGDNGNNGDVTKDNNGKKKKKGNLPVGVGKTKDQVPTKDVLTVAVGDAVMDNEDESKKKENDKLKVDNDATVHVMTDQDIKQDAATNRFYAKNSNEELEEGTGLPMTTLQRGLPQIRTSEPGAVAMEGPGWADDENNNHTNNNSDSNPGYDSPAINTSRSRPEEMASSNTTIPTLQSSTNTAIADDHNTLAQAQPVPEEDLPQASAEPVYQKSLDGRDLQEPNNCPGKKKSIAIIALGLILVLIIGIVLGLTLSSRDDDSDNNKLSSSTQDTNPSDGETLTNHFFTPEMEQRAQSIGVPTATLERIQREYDDYDTSSTLPPPATQLSPQARALEWVLEEYDLYESPRLLQRFALAVLYFSANGPNWDLQSNWLNHNQSECTDWWFKDSIDYSVDQWAIGWVTAGSDSAVESTSSTSSNNNNRKRKSLLRRNLQDDDPATTGKLKSACNEAGEYEIMVLRGNSLEGTIPTELFLLSHLVLLDLSNNEGLRGSIPSEIGNLSKLRRVSVERNSHTGRIPTTVGNLTQLETLYMEHLEDLTGPIPTELGLLSTHLRVLSLGRSGLTGYVPTELYQLTELRNLRIQNIKGVTGGTLNGMEALTNIENAVVHDVPYNSTIPSELGLLTNMQVLNLWNTQVYGSIPSELWQLTKMTRIDLENNYLTGTFPQELRMMSDLTLCFMDNNLFTGTVPVDIWNVFHTLYALTLHATQLTGSIPSTMGLMTTMEELWVADMPVSSTIPSELAQMSGLQMLFLHKTGLTGTIPVELSTLESLNILTLSNTSVAGAVPDTLCDALHDMEFSCRTVLGVEEQVCAQVDLKNFSCDASALCGCSCAPCPQ